MGRKDRVKAWQGPRGHAEEMRKRGGSGRSPPIMRHEYRDEVPLRLRFLEV